MRKPVPRFGSLIAKAALALCLAVPASGAGLIDAAAEGDVATVRSLLQAGADVNEAAGDGMTALHVAAERRDGSLAAVLLHAGANVSAGTRIGHYTPLHTASRQGAADVVGLLLAAGADPHLATGNSGARPIHLAAASGSVAAVRALLEAGADPDARESAWGQTPLIFAAAKNRAAVIAALLDAGADPSLTAEARDTALMEAADKAAEKRLEEILGGLRDKAGGGPDWRPQPSQVQAAIQAAREIQRRWPDVPDPDCDDDRADVARPARCTVLTPGAAETDGPADDEEALPRLLSYGQLVGAWGGLSPLHHAVRQGHVAAVRALLAGGANVNQPTAGDGTTPLLMAAINGQYDLALALLAAGADPNRVSDAGTSALFAVLERQWAPRASYAHPVEHRHQAATHLDVMRALLEAGADPDRRLDRRLWFMEYTFNVLEQAGVHYAGATPFWRAAHALDVPAMRLLKDHGADTGIATIRLPPRRRARPMPEPADESLEEKADLSGLPPVPVGGPFIYPIHIAAGAGYGQQFAGNAHRHAPDAWLPAVRFLVEECGADVNARDANGYTPLHHAASRGDNAMIRYLVARGADVMAVSRKGQTTVDMANGPIQRLSPFPDTIALLESYGAINNHQCVSC